MIKSSLSTTMWTKINARVPRVSGSKPWAGTKGRRLSKSADDIHYKSPNTAVIEACLNCPYSNCSGSCHRIEEVIRDNNLSRREQRIVKRGEIPGDFAELYMAGMSRMEFKARYRVSDSTIDRWIKKLGLKRKLAEARLVNAKTENT